MHGGNAKNGKGNGNCGLVGSTEGPNVGNGMWNQIGTESIGIRYCVCMQVPGYLRVEG